MPGLQGTHDAFRPAYADSYLPEMSSAKGKACTWKAKA